MRIAHFDLHRFQFDITPPYRIAFFPRTKANETSADAYFNGRYNGAFTYHFVKVMRDTKNKLSRRDVIANMRKQMKLQFAQNPQLEGNATNRAQAIIY